MSVLCMYMMEIEYFYPSFQIIYLQHGCWLLTVFISVKESAVGSFLVYSALFSKSPFFSIQCREQHLEQVKIGGGQN